MSNSTVRLNLADLLSPDEREMFVANAKVAGRKPDQHLKALVFGEGKRQTTPTPRKKGPRK